MDPTPTQAMPPAPPSRPSPPAPLSWSPATPPPQATPPLQAQPGSTPPQKKGGRGKWIAGGAVVVLVLAAIGAIASSSAPTAVSATPSPKATNAAVAGASLAVASPTDGTTEEPTASDDRTAVEPTEGITPEPTPPPTAQPTPKPTPIAYKKLTARSWKLLVKAPDKFEGKAYQLWACIWQFDAATGEESFLGNASYKKLTYWNLDGESSSFSGDADRLSNFVEGDVVVMNVISTGSYSYDTQAGGNTTVPSFDVKKITRKGSCD